MKSSSCNLECFLKSEELQNKYQKQKEQDIDKINEAKIEQINKLYELDKDEKTEMEKQIMQNIMEDFSNIVSDFDEKKQNGLCSSDEIEKFD